MNNYDCGLSSFPMDILIDWFMLANKIYAQLNIVPLYTIRSRIGTMLEGSLHPFLHIAYKLGNFPP